MDHQPSGAEHRSAPGQKVPPRIIQVPPPILIPLQRDLPGTSRRLRDRIDEASDLARLLEGQVAFDGQYRAAAVLECCAECSLRGTALRSIAATATTLELVFERVHEEWTEKLTLRIEHF